MRDPRTDPRPGDVVKGRSGFSRRVFDVRMTNLEPTVVAKIRYIGLDPMYIRRGSLSVAGWQRWARGGDVLKQSDFTHPDTRAGELIPEDGA